MNQGLTSYIKHLLCVILIYIILPISSRAQNTAEADTTFGLGTFNGTVKVVKVQPDGKFLVGGDFTYYKNTPVNHIARLNADGTLDNAFNIVAGTNSAVLVITLQPDGKIIIGGNFTSCNGVSMNGIARLNVDGTRDNSFAIGSGVYLTPTIIASVFSIAIQSDGKVIIGGSFYTYNGIASNCLARLNADGTLDNSFNIGQGPNSVVYGIAIQPDNKIIIVGDFLKYDGTTLLRIVRLNTNGSRDITFNIGSGVNGTSVKTVSCQPDGKIIIGGGFVSYNGTSIKCIARLNSDGTLDGSFNVGLGIEGNTSTVYSAALQPDGKIIVVGIFLTYNGVPSKCIVRINGNGTLDNTFNIGTGTNTIVYSCNLGLNGKLLIGGDFKSYNDTVRNYIANINSDGSLDPVVNSALGANGNIHACIIEPNGKIILGGGFSGVNTKAIKGVARLNLDGTLDNSFDPGLGTNDYVWTTARQPDGKIIIGGAFTSYNGIPRNRIARLNANGSLDNSFNVGIGANNLVYSISLQNDGKIIIGGEFTNYDGVSRNYIARLNADGSLDNTFNIGSGFSGSFMWVYKTVVQPDGKIIVGGVFTSYNGVSKNRIARLNSDGTLDNTFNIGSGADNSVNDIALQSDGKIILVGTFTTFNGFPRNSIVRLTHFGNLDFTFDIGTGANNAIESVTLQNDNKVMIGGIFTNFNGVSSNGIARLNADGSVDNSLNVGIGLPNYSYGTKSIAVQSNGAIIVCGWFIKYRGISYNGMIRLKGDPIYLNTIKGKIYTDNNNDCVWQSTEKAISSVVVKAMPGPFYGGTDAYGNYQLKVDSGNVSYTLSQKYNSVNAKVLKNQCSSSHLVALNGASIDTASFDFADFVNACSLLNINIQNTRMRRCFRNNTYVNYCNYGNNAAYNVQIKIEYPSYVVPVSSIPMWTSKQGSVLIYNMGTLPEDFCGEIVLTDSVICGNETIRGLTQCIKATISPASDCIVENPGWDKSSVQVIGDGLLDSTRFVIKNEGSGNMNATREFRMYVNDTLIYNGSYILKTGEQLLIKYPNEGQTIRLEADQDPLHPGKSRPRAIVENFLSSPTFVPGKHVTTPPQDDVDEEVAITCNTIVDSYDPNDKQSIPSGIGVDHQVPPGEELEYTIRFQNTGTHTAYSVRIVDTLDASLDVSSFIQGASSHPYRLEVTGKGQAVMVFNFDDIQLPDSTTNKAGSNGLVSYRITIPSSAALGTVIHNKAYIYFDYNSPVLTNETVHKVGVNVEQNLSKGAKVQVGYMTTGLRNKYINSQIKLYPNPSTGIITIESPVSGNNSELRILSMLGVVQKSVSLSQSNLQEVTLEGINHGTYLYEIWQEGERKTGGILQFR